MHDWSARRGRLGLFGRRSLTGLLGAVMTVAAIAWYQDERQYTRRTWNAGSTCASQPWRELIVETPVSSRGTRQIPALHGTYRRDPRLRRVLGRLSNGLPLRRAHHGHPISDVPQSVSWVVARARAGTRQAASPPGRRRIEIGIASACRRPVERRSSQAGAVCRTAQLDAAARDGLASGRARSGRAETTSRRRSFT